MNENEEEIHDLPEAQANAMGRWEWVGNCARRLCEMNTTMSARDAHQLASQMATQTEPHAYRDMHPVAAAECFMADCAPGTTALHEKLALWRKAP